MNKIARKKNRNRELTPYLLIAGLVAMVGIVAASVFSNGVDLEGAVSSTTDALKYQGYCSDTDPKDDFFVAGTVQMNNKLYSDSCSNGVLYQHYCSSGRNVKTRRPYFCPQGCIDGVCLS